FEQGNSSLCKTAISYMIHSLQIMGIANVMTDYERIKRSCLKRGELWEDPEFPATQASVFYHQTPPFQFVWKRPKQVYKSNLSSLVAQSRSLLKHSELLKKKKSNYSRYLTL
ncbi:hypothetical protein L9F63_000632, partial [Diploptera punctata]